VKEQDIEYPKTFAARIDCLGELHSSSLDFSPDGKVLAIATIPDWSSSQPPAGFAGLKLWHTDTYQEETTLPEGYPEYAQSVRFSPDGKFLAVAYGILVNLWDMERREWLAPSSYYAETWDIIFSLEFTTDSKYLILVYGGREFYVWEVSTRRDRKRLEFVTDQLLSFIAINPKGNELVSGSWEAHTIAFWDVDAIIAMFEEENHAGYRYAEGHPTAVLHHGAPVWAVGYSPNGELVASGGEDGKVKLWDAVTKQEVAALNHGASVYSIAFSPDGALLVSNSGDAIHVWNLLTHQKVGTLLEPANIVRFSPCGKFLASAMTFPGMVTLWR